MPIKNFFITLILLISFVSMLIFPQEVFKASLRGLDAWWNIVFPALFPFFVISELLMSFGLVRFLGVLLEPLMRPLFNVPGTGAIVIAFGYTSGAPIGSIITARLRNDKQLSKVEAERLFSFTNNASPLFMLGAVAVGMLNKPSLGVTIAGAHYLANILLGIFFLRNWGRSSNKRLQNFSQDNLFKNAYYELIKAYQEQNKTLGELLSESIKKSINTSLLVGGFIILFSTIIELFNIYGVIDIIAYLLNTFCSFISIDLSKAIASGLIEMTVGAKLICETPENLQFKIAAISFILGWAGISVHAQVMAMINNTDIRFLPFFITRLLHGPLAAVISLTIFHPVSSVFKTWQPLTLSTPSLQFYLYSFLILFIILIIEVIASIIFYYFQKIYKIIINL